MADTPQYRVWLLHGFGGSDLWQYVSQVPPQASYSRQLWLTEATFANPDIAAALIYPVSTGALQPGATAVVSPARPGGRFPLDGRYSVGGSLQSLTARLNRPYAGLTIEFVPFFYDWRLSVLANAQFLADEIASRAPLAQGDKIIGYSLGGLVAVAAWGLLNQASNAGRISRIITLGSPLFGTPTVGQTWAGYASELNTNAAVQGLLRGAITSPLFQPIWQRQSIAAQAGQIRARLMRAFSSWPSVYDLLPAPSMEDDPGDSNRALYWQASTWAAASAPPNAALLTTTPVGSTSWHAWRDNRANRPPAGVLIHVVGSGSPTPGRIQPRQPLRAFPQILRASGQYVEALYRAQFPTWASASNGDTISGAAGQQFPGYPTWTLTSDHAGLPSHPDLARYLFNLLSDSYTGVTTLDPSQEVVLEPANQPAGQPTADMHRGLPPSAQPGLHLALPLTGSQIAMISGQGRPAAANPTGLPEKMLTLPLGHNKIIRNTTAFRPRRGRPLHHNGAPVSNP